MTKTANFPEPEQTPHEAAALEDNAADVSASWSDDLKLTPLLLFGVLLDMDYGERTVSEMLEILQSDPEFAHEAEIRFKERKMLFDRLLDSFLSAR